jgi:neutral ceramidase
MLAAGHGEAVITPPLGVALSGYMVSEGREAPATEVYEDLMASALALRHEDGGTLCLLALDVIGVPEPLRAAIARAAEELGIPAGAVQIAATHTHSGPELEEPVAGVDPERSAPWNPAAITAVLTGARAALVAALADIDTVDVHHGEAVCTINVNRREQGEDGVLKGLPWMGQNPDGPADHAVRTLRLTRREARDIVVAVYGCHPVVLGIATGISPDLFGAARRRASSVLGGHRVMLLQGVSGDVNPIIHPGSREDCERLGATLGDAIAAAVTDDVAVAVDAVAVGRIACPLPVRQEFDNPDDDPMIADWITMWQGRSAGQDGIDAHLSVARIGPLGLLGLPVELFTSIGERIRAASPLSTTLIVTLCDGKLGYLPDAGAYAEGGYEVLTTPFAPGADDVLVEAAVALLNQIAETDPAGHRFV